MMNPYIGPRPTFPCRILLKGKEDRKNTVFPFNQKKCYYFFSGRYAIRAGIKALGIGPEDVILFPSYNCGVELDPFLRLNIKPTFYRIGKDLLVDLEDLQGKIDQNTKAIFITHFLGFPQPMNEIKEICRQKDLLLIEDCAHAFLSKDDKNFLGSYGDIAIFSIRKTLPIPDGGILLINRENIKQNQNNTIPELFSTYYFAMELLRYRTYKDKNSIREKCEKYFFYTLYNFFTLTRFWLRAYRKLFRVKRPYLMRPDSPDFVRDACTWTMSNLSKNIINVTNFEQVKAARRNNFEYLLDHFTRKNGPELIYKELPPGVSPLFFPILVESSIKRDRLYNSLKRRGVATHPWWQEFHEGVPWSDFPDAVYLKERLFGLPIHQDLTFGHLNQVLEEFEKAYISI